MIKRITDAENQEIRESISKPMLEIQKKYGHYGPEVIVPTIISNLLEFIVFYTRNTNAMSEYDLVKVLIAAIDDEVKRGEN